MKKFKAFIALDATNNKKNIEVVKKLYKFVYGFKVGYRSFYNKDADKLIAEIKRKKSRLFLDLKVEFEITIFESFFKLSLTFLEPLISNIFEAEDF